MIHFFEEQSCSISINEQSMPSAGESFTLRNACNDFATASHFSTASLPRGRVLSALHTDTPMKSFAARCGTLSTHVCGLNGRSLRPEESSFCNDDDALSTRRVCTGAAESTDSRGLPLGAVTARVCKVAKTECTLRAANGFKLSEDEQSVCDTDELSSAEVRCSIARCRKLTSQDLANNNCEKRLSQSDGELCQSDPSSSSFKHLGRCNCCSSSDGDKKSDVSEASVEDDDLHGSCSADHYEQDYHINSITDDLAARTDSYDSPATSSDVACVEDEHLNTRNQQAQECGSPVGSTCNDFVSHGSSEEKSKLYVSSHQTATDTSNIKSDFYAKPENAGNLPPLFFTPSGNKSTSTSSDSTERNQQSLLYMEELFITCEKHLPFQLHPSQDGDLEEYYNLMCLKEQHSHPILCLKNQPKIRHSMRKILVEWLTKISHHYKLHGQSLHLMVNVLDRYTERQNSIYRGHYQLLGVTSFLLAAKQLEVDIPPINTCLMLCQNVYTRTQLLTLERHILNVLEFDLNVPTAHTFLDYFIIYGHRSGVFIPGGYCANDSTTCDRSYSTAMLKKTLCLARNLVEIGLADYSFCQYLPSVAAKAALTLAVEPLLSSQNSFCRSFWTPNSQFWGGAGVAMAPSFKMELLKCRKLEPGEDIVLDCIADLRKVVGARRLIQLNSSLDHVVEKYSFE